MFSIYLFYMEERWVNFLLKLQNCYLLLNRFFQRLCKRVNLFKDLLVHLLQFIIPSLPNSFLKYFFRHCLQQHKSSLRFSWHRFRFVVVSCLRFVVVSSEIESLHCIGAPIQCRIFSLHCIGAQIQCRSLVCSSSLRRCLRLVGAAKTMS